MRWLVEAGLMENENELVRRAATGDAEAFRCLYNVYADGIRRFCLSMVQSMEAADEMTQETFLNAYRALPRFRFESRFGTWLCRIARNTCVNFIRKERRCGECASNTEKLNQVPDPQSGIDRVLKNEETEIHKRCVEELPPNQRTAYELLSFGYSYKDIALAMGQTFDQARGLIQRAQDNVKRCIKKRFGIGA